MANELHVQGMIETEIKKRLSDYPFLKDLETRRLECVSDRSELNVLQFHPPLGFRALHKLKKWEEYGDAYIYRYWRNATINYCRGVIKNGRKIDKDSNTNVNDPNEIKRVSQLAAKRKHLESFLDPLLHSKNKITCFLDRLDGMTFSAMMKKYEPRNFYKDKKGQKYFRRFSRFVSDELDIKQDVVKYFELLTPKKPKPVKKDESTK